MEMEQRVFPVQTIEGFWFLKNVNTANERFQFKTEVNECKNV